MNSSLLEQFKRLILTHTGLNIREQDYNSLRNTLNARTKALKMVTPHHYYSLISDVSERSNKEWKKLTLQLTTGESYFFRDKGQFEILEKKILPELVMQRKRERTLRVWSAGCSTGEEPYSIAMLLDRVIPFNENWNVYILGTDLNEEAVNMARSGHYSDWSFRKVEPEIRTLYFKKRKERWEIVGKLKEKVTFTVSNLIRDNFPNQLSGIYDMDLILCRNVFIYFDQDSISNVIKKFSATLNRGGYLITGHAELYAQDLGKLFPRMFPESIVYQCCNDEPSEVKKNSAYEKLQTLTKGNDSLKVKQTSFINSSGNKNPFFNKQKSTFSNFHKHKIEKLLPEAKELIQEFPSLENINVEALFSNGNYKEAIKEAEKAFEKNPLDFDACHIIAKSYANLAQYDNSLKWCKKAMEINALADGPYYIMALLAEEKGDPEEAKSLFKKVLYLAPSNIPAYIELGAIYERESNLTKAKKMRSAAFDLLKREPPDNYIEPYKDYTAGELARYLKRMIDESDG